ncbi:hypothetical protein [Arthrobacter sp. A5]|uniref:hypothetical protein n=1 Tax=Arthrobacter sp. A5 TaxID=576926 RepID=UPI003DA8E8E7
MSRYEVCNLNAAGFQTCFQQRWEERHRAEVPVDGGELVAPRVDVFGGEGDVAACQRLAIGLVWGVVILTSIYGVAWLVGATIIGALYAASLPGVLVFIVASQGAALLLFIPLMKRGTPRTGVEAVHR